VVQRLTQGVLAGGVVARLKRASHPGVRTAAAGEQDAGGEGEPADRPREVSSEVPHGGFHAATSLPLDARG
jgi:hypothetical protein